MKDQLPLAPAFSFVYDGTDSHASLGSWETTEHESAADGDVTVRTTTWADGHGMEVDLETSRFADSPAVEWVMRFRNTAHVASGVLSDILPLDLTLSSPGAPLVDTYLDRTGNPRPCAFQLHYSTGGLAGAHDYEPHVQNIGGPGAGDFELGAGSGRSSNRHLPFFNLRTGERSGIVGAVGWSGQWQARFTLERQGQLRLRAGMEKTHLRLQPGEEIRTPRMVLLPWNGGDLIDSHNLWRRFMRRHHTLPLRGAEPFPQTWCDTYFTFNEGSGVNETNQIASVDGAARLGIETLTIDAGWYEHNQSWWDGVGNWAPRPDAFPNGFRPIAARGQTTGTDLGVWYECERAFRDTRTFREHPEFLLKRKDQGDNPQFLVNLGLPAAQDWFIDLVSEHVAEGIRWFRHDFNIDPLAYWRDTDADDRQGMTEIRYIEGLYRVYDELRKRHPDLLIEGCASGGRRIDLETVSRNHGYWATDMMCGTPEPMQAHIHGFNRYLLPHVHNTVLQQQNAPKANTPEDRYRFFSFIGGAPCICFDVRDSQAFDTALCRHWLALFKRLRHLTMGDFYPLSEYSLSPAVWHAMQFHRHDLDEGLVAVFRRPDSPCVEASLPLRGLSSAAEYELIDVLSESSGPRTGEALMHGLDIVLPSCPDAVLLHYRPLTSR